MRQKATNVLLWNVREVSYMTQNLGEGGGGRGWPLLLFIGIERRKEMFI